MENLEALTGAQARAALLETISDPNAKASITKILQEIQAKEKDTLASDEVGSIDANNNSIKVPDAFLSEGQSRPGEVVVDIDGNIHSVPAQPGPSSVVIQHSNGFSPVFVVQEETNETAASITAASESTPLRSERAEKRKSSSRCAHFNHKEKRYLYTLSCMS